MDNQTRRILLERVKASGFPGSIIDVFKNPVILDDYIAQQQNQQQQPIVAQTPQEQEQGLRPFHQQGQVNQSMAFPNVQPNQSFNTVGMKIPIDINKYNNQGHLVESYKAVPPGITNLPTGPNQGTIIESPARMQKGGVKKYQTGGPYNPFQYAVTDPERMRTMLQFPGQYVAPTVDIVDKSQFVPMSVPGVSGSMKTVYVNPKTKDRYETPQTTKAQLASSDIARSNNVDPIGMGILAASTGAPLIRTAANALPYLNAPLTIGGRVFPAVTAGNALMAAGAANSTEQILNPNSELRTNPDAYNIGMTGLGYVGLGVGKNISNMLSPGAKNISRFAKNEILARTLARNLNRGRLPEINNLQQLAPRIDLTNKSSINVKSDLYESLGSKDYDEAINYLYDRLRHLYDKPIITFKSSMPSSMFKGVAAEDNAVQGMLFKEKFCLPGSECAKTSNAVTSGIFKDITGKPFAIS